MRGAAPRIRADVPLSPVRVATLILLRRGYVLARGGLAWRHPRTDHEIMKNNGCQPADHKSVLWRAGFLNAQPGGRYTLNQRGRALVDGLPDDLRKAGMEAAVARFRAVAIEQRRHRRFIRSLDEARGRLKSALGTI